jgi:hypothetical protein
VAVYCENHTEHINTLCGQTAGSWYVKAGGVYRTKTKLLSITTTADQHKLQCDMWEVKRILRRHVPKSWYSSTRSYNVKSQATNQPTP